MGPKSHPPDSPSPSKKRRTETTHVKKGVDFFFKQRIQKHQQSAPVSDGGDNAKLFVASDAADEEVKRIRQEQEDERFARELQEWEGMQEVDDAQFARSLARDYEALDGENKNAPVVKEHVDGEVKNQAKEENNTMEEDLYGANVLAVKLE